MDLITVDSEVGKELTFTSERFDPRSYLCRVDGTVYVSHIHTTEMGKGYFGQLVRSIWDKGLIVKVPSPYQRMEKILRHYGARPTIEFDLRMGPCEVWILPPPQSGDDTLQSSLS